MALYKHVDPSDMARAVSKFSTLPFKDIDPSDIVGQIKKADATVRDRDRSDYVSAMNKIVTAAGNLPDPVAIVSLWNTNPAKCMVASVDLPKFTNGMVVTVAGVQAPWAATVNGARTIANVGVGGSWFDLVGVNLSAAGTTIGYPGMTVTPPTG